MESNLKAALLLVFFYSLLMVIAWSCLFLVSELISFASPVQAISGVVFSQFERLVNFSFFVEIFLLFIVAFSTKEKALYIFPVITCLCYVIAYRFHGYEAVKLVSFFQIGNQYPYIGLGYLILVAGAISSFLTHRYLHS